MNSGEMRPVAGVGDAFGVLLALDRADYPAGAPIRAEIRAFAPVDEPLVLEFTSAQRTDLSIETADGREVVRWGDGRLFAQVMGQVSVGPDGLLGELEVKAPETPGRYRVSAWVTAVNRQVTATMEIEVRAP